MKTIKFRNTLGKGPNMNNDFNNGQNGTQNEQSGAPQDFGRSKEAQQAWENGQTTWSNQGTPYSNVPQTPNDKAANSSQTMGIVGLLLSLLCCGTAGLILGILAYSKAKLSRLTLGFEVPEARTGRICGIIAIVMGIIRILAVGTIVVLYILGIAVLVNAFGDLTAFMRFR